MKIYLANQLGFSTVGHKALTHIIQELENINCQVYEPLEETRKALERGMAFSATNIGKLNETAMVQSDLMVAILDGGHQVDDGVASEIGYCTAMKKKIFGLRTDIRTCDSTSSTVNIQIEYFIEKSGGKICTTLADLLESILKS